MKMVFNAMFGLALAMGFTSVASAAPSPTGPAWSCQIKAKLEGFEGGLIVVVKVLEGEGKMECKSVTGDVIKTFPIHMEIKGAGLGAGFSTPENLEFVTGDIGVADPRAIYGKYSGGISADGTLVDIGGTVGVGLAFSKAGASIRGVLAGGDSQGILGAITGSVVYIQPL